jgi:hypothetical protein|tara:strand:+ start:738 stop:908 length:171 start_codon:yes stop_codon:yes gene_type:complete
MEQNKLAKKYELAYKKLYAELPQWKRELVDEKHSRQATELAKEVIRYAEKNKEDED